MNDLVIGGNFSPNVHTCTIPYTPDNVKFTPVFAAETKTLWLVPDNQNAHYIWCSGGKGSRGLGGSEKEFPLVNDIVGSIKLKGPWHANSHDLFKETLIDLRSRHLTWGVLATGMHDGNDRSVLTGVIYFDNAPTFGTLDRVELMGRSLLANGEYEKLYYFSESCGGCSYGQV